MVANESLEKADPGPPGLMALHPLRRMLIQVKCLREHPYSFLG